jgi:hypothetical protein
MSVRRVLLFGGIAAVALLRTTPAGALPRPPTLPGVPLPAPPALGAQPVGAVLATVPALDPATSALPSPQVVRLPHAGDLPPNVAPLPTKSFPTPTLPTASPPALPTDQQRVNASGGAVPPAASHARHDGAARRDRPASIERERATVAPVVNSAVLDARPVGVRGALDSRSNGQPWAPLGTAETGLALWGALCALALVARVIVISAWRDAPRRRRALSLR